jgi:hypothetical protein
MFRKKNDNETAFLLHNTTDVQSIVNGRIVQSSTFRILLGFINLYILLGFVLYLLVKGNLIDGVNTDFLDQGYFSVLNIRSTVVLVFLMVMNISAYYNHGFKYLSLILFVYMLNSAIDTNILFSDFALTAERPYFSTFQLSRPLLLISLLWVAIVHKDTVKGT